MADVPGAASVNNLYEGINQSENNRAARLSELNSAITAERNARDATTAIGVDQAIRQAYNDPQTPVSQDPSGAQNLTSGQTLVQQIPVTNDAPKPPPSPLANIQLPNAPPAATPVSISQLQAPTPNMSVPAPPPAGAYSTPSEAMTVAPASSAPASPPAAPVAAPAAPTAMGAPKAPGLPPVASTPFDTPDFQNRLAAHLANVPGGGQQLMQIKATRDDMITKVMGMIANGQTDEARFVAQRNGLSIPDGFYQNGDLARGMELASKAYPDEPDKGQAFYQAFMQNPQGSLADRVQIGMSVAGVPTPAATRELNKAMALAKFQSTLPKPYIGPGGGLIMVNPGDSTAQPVTMNGTGAPVTVTAGYGLKTGRPQSRFMNVGGQLVDTQTLDGQGRPSVVVAKNSDPTQAKINLANHIMSAGINVDPKDAADQAEQVYQQLHAAPGATASPTAATTTMPAQAKSPLGSTQMPAAQAKSPVTVTAPATPASSPFDGGGMIHVKNPATGDERLIQPTDLSAAQNEGYQQVQ